MNEKQKERFTCVRQVLKGAVNDILVCSKKNNGSAALNHGEYVTLWVLKEHSLTKQILQTLYEGESGIPIQESFSSGNFVCCVLPYREERPLIKFYKGRKMETEACRILYQTLVLECMSNKIPFPFLYLILEQKQIRLDAANEVSFQYFLDFTDFDSKKSEADCVYSCAGLLLKLMEQKRTEFNPAYCLVSKKMEREQYSNFHELYRDISIPPLKKEKFRLRKAERKIKAADKSVLRILCRLSGICVIAAIFVFLSSLLFGDFLPARLLRNSFEIIGTESLTE